MDARTKRQQAQDNDDEISPAKRDRLLASLTLIAGIGLLITLPFALRAGAEFFMPVTAALVVAIALVPMLEWFERRGVPSRAASALCLVIFLAFAIFAIGSIVIPATDWVAQVPQKIGHVRSTLEPVFDLYKNLDRFIDRTMSQIAITQERTRAVRIETPNSMLGLLTSSAPHLLIQLFFSLLVIYFFLAGWTAMRKKTIVSRGSFEGALTTARVIQQVVDATSTYLGTITVINIGLGALTALLLWQLGMDSPVMWGGIVAVANYIPYLGPIVCALLLFFGGLMTFPDIWAAMLPPAAFISLHLVEANVLTPLVVGHRLTISPLAILVSLSFWAWVWGTTGALLAVPLLIIMKTVFSAAGTPDIAGFLFEHGTLTHVGEPDEEEEDERREIGPPMVDTEKPAT
ncbi:AI-2E family transporter [Sphingomonas hankyongi]|uniref:AI-2E family transporter n=1 Tax=Sphingomonas hankyongi TaxID=2908209 RepID=A0ABT0S4F1_9SPHN|nr:AI-2E family transporter [Sphingomonas hankyongi]MCL6730662.1 AI-2E family transporter [Sphingomonas hankyongi]